MMYEIFRNEELQWKYSWKEAERNAWSKARITMAISNTISLILLVLIGNANIFEVSVNPMIKILAGAIEVVVIIGIGIIISHIRLSYELRKIVLPRFNQYLKFHRYRKSIERKEEES